MDEKTLCGDCQFKNDCDESPYVCGYVMFPGDGDYYGDDI